VIADRYRFLPNQVMVEVREYPTYDNGVLCQVCGEKPVSHQVRWINAPWTGQYNFRYICDNNDCINVAKHSFIKEQDEIYNKPV
jgi:hypothetical protein